MSDINNTPVFWFIFFNDQLLLQKKVKHIQSLIVSIPLLKSEMSWKSVYFRIFPVVQHR